MLLEGINGVEANMARSLLAGAGIPCLLHGPDFDVAELGRAVHDSVRGTSLLVPQTALERAREVLQESGWSPDGDSSPGQGE